MTEEDIVEVWSMTGETTKELSIKLGVPLGRVIVALRSHCTKKALQSDKHMLEIELSRTRIKLHGYRIELDELNEEMLKENRDPFAISRRVEVIEHIHNLEKQLKKRRDNLV